MGFYGTILYNLREMGFPISMCSVMEDGSIKYTHNVIRCVPQYLTVLKYLDKRGKCAEKFKKAIPSLERIVENKDDPDKNDIRIAGGIIDSYPLRNFVIKIFPGEIGEIDDIISDMNTSELEKYIDSIEKKFEPNENLDVIIAYLNHCLDYKYACEYYGKRFVMSYEERVTARESYNAIARINDAAKVEAARQASKGRII